MLKLVLGNRNYSSWSMRGWLALKMTGAPFAEELYHLGEAAVREKIRLRSPTARVPALQDGDLIVWDSLAIFEYLAERFPEAGLWPAERSRRAIARSLVAEMHSGFPALRRSMPFNVRRSSPGQGREPGVAEEITRVTAIWRERLAGGYDDGPFLFGRWCLADVAYAPVVSRFRTYAVELDACCGAYSDAVWDQPDVAEWRAAAEAEPMVESEFDR